MCFWSFIEGSVINLLSLLCYSQNTLQIIPTRWSKGRKSHATSVSDEINRRDANRKAAASYVFMKKYSRFSITARWESRQWENERRHPVRMIRTPSLRAVPAAEGGREIRAHIGTEGWKKERERGGRGNRERIPSTRERRGGETGTKCERVCGL